jgi:hypothetical protein
MSNNSFLTKDGRRWQRADRIRVARLFRAHVDTPSNRRRGRSCRIQRRDCHWHPGVTAEAHHVDYARPFAVVWAGLLCGCHRRIEHGTLTVTRRAIWDYTSLIEGPFGIARPGGRAETRARSDAETGAVQALRGRTAARAAGVPF